MPAGTFASVYAPEASVLALRPAEVIVAPEIGAPLAASLTMPVRVPALVGVGLGVGVGVAVGLGLGVGVGEGLGVGVGDGLAVVVRKLNAIREARPNRNILHHLGEARG